MLEGTRVEWLHRVDNVPTVEFRGMVVAVQRGGNPATWSVLVLCDDATLRYTGPENLRVLPSEKLMIRIAESEPFQMLDREPVKMPIPGDGSSDTTSEALARALGTSEKRPPGRPKKS
jgi:hypothetical protein